MPHRVPAAKISPGYHFDPHLGVVSDDTNQPLNINDWKRYDGFPVDSGGSGSNSSNSSNLDTTSIILLVAGGVVGVILLKKLLTSKK